MDIKRKEDWHNLLHDHIEAKRDDPFAWGTSDCLAFACGCVNAMTGTDILDGISYASEKDALRLLTKGATVKKTKHDGPKKVSGFWDHFFPRRETPRFAHTGDIVTFAINDGLVGQSINTGARYVYTGDTRLSLSGVVAFDGMKVAAMTEGGLALFSIEDCDVAWHTQTEGGV